MAQSVFLKACRREPTEYTPVWIMRQAGRYMEEYRKIREKYGFLEMCKTPEIAAEVTLQPVKKLGVDAAILFADILLPLEGMGIGFEFSEGEGPVIKNPVRTTSDVEAIQVRPAEETVPYVLETIRILRRELNNTIPLIGFSGAPFTLASYIIEGGHSRNYLLTKSLMFNDMWTWHKLMEKLTEIVRRYLQAQVEAGAQALQVFDSWIGCLSPSDYKAFVKPHMKKLFSELAQTGVPIIHFGTDTSTLLEEMRDAGGDVIGVDWRTPLDNAWERIGFDRAVQGNLDPVVLFGSREFIEARVNEVLEQAGGKAGHIFNLGHGILPETPVENVVFMVETVHRLSRRKEI